MGYWDISKSVLSCLLLVASSRYIVPIRDDTGDRLNEYSIPSTKEERKRIYDSIFKSTIKKTDVLASFLHEYVDEYMDMTREEILACIDKEATGRYAKECNPQPLGEKDGSRVDSLFRVRLPDSDGSVAVYVNVEGQNKFHLPYPLENRAESYVSELLYSQNGKEMHNHDYGNLKKVYSIWLLFDPPKKLMNTAIRYDRQPYVLFGEPQSDIPKMDLTHVIMVYIGRYRKDLPDALALVSALFSDSLDSDTRFRTLDSRFKIRFNDKERREVEEMVSLHDSFYEGYVSYGMELGRIEAKINTMATNATSIATNLNMTLDQAIEALDVPSDIIDEVRQKAEQLLREKN